MTNEEKILNAFPNATARIIENKDFRYIEVEQNDEWIADFSIEWWHSEYKEPKTGHWIIIKDKEDWNEWTCSKCGHTERTYKHLSLGFNFCPKCGAKMD